MRNRTFIVAALLLCAFALKAQILIGTFHLSAFNKDYKVIIDDMESRFNGKPVKTQIKDLQIFIQVEMEEPDLEGYLMIKPRRVSRTLDNLKEYYDDAVKYARRHSMFRKKIERENAEFYLLKPGATPIYGYESGQNYRIYMEQSIDNKIYVSYQGEEVRSEGKDKLRAQGWRLAFASMEEVDEMAALVKRAVAAIESNTIPTY